MIPIRSIVVSAVLLSEIEGELKILLMKRVKGNFWCHIAGKVEEGETASQAILREIQEETEIQVQRLFSADYLEQFYEPSLNVIEMIPAFVGFCTENQAVLLNHEHTEYRWCSLSEAKTLAVFSNQRRLYDFVWDNFAVQSPLELLRII
ncbi:NUDIX domain-containing protein [Acinetobacter sp. ANC 4910]|uniref:NUDIX hydrolase n=1 Tax=Acinetobacter sp. ANC 4910 TaxID=2529850 RepID=UPI00103BD784|nr:NUDIX domain-containing protein [Acinetobacter sp. ANC 4910]TCB35733.1 NUDIX domain-containing protein [Acinetobacter sp. ANC 4910]